jgi:hypothetical protein
MEHAASTASRALARSSESVERTQAHSAIRTEQRAARVWLAMAELYGPAFAAAYGDKPSPLWSAAIGELTDDECRSGLTSLAREGRDYPANLTQFVAACRPPKMGSPRYLGVPITDEQRAELYLPKPAVPVEKIDGWLAKMRRTLGVGQ